MFKKLGFVVLCVYAAIGMAFTGVFAAMQLGWFNVRGATAVVQVAGAATVFDWEIPANATRSYRVAQFTTAGIGSLPSAWSATQTATSVLNAFWLSDPLAQSVGINPHVLKGTLTTSPAE